MLNNIKRLKIVMDNTLQVEQQLEEKIVNGIDSFNSEQKIDLLEELQVKTEEVIKTALGGKKL